jgi:UDP-N-acetylmuramyl pentapeptide phosphotransferase/UDP-N-acetylglucosamine-1-phosphate transferase
VLVIAFLSFLVSMVAVLFVRRWFRRHALNYSADMPQRFHKGAVPRLGGVGMLLGWLVGLTVLAVLPRLGVFLGVSIDWTLYVAMVVVVSMVVLVGAAEDVTQRVSVRWRLACTGLAGVLAVWWLGVSVPRVGWPVLDAMWAAWPWLGMGLAVFAIMGLTHAFNIIDGYNGLAGLVAVMIGLALTHIALQVGDRQLAVLSLVMVATTAGFLVWNYPRGLIFAGDGGAYLWGVVIALISILLVQRHPMVSPWFVVLLLIYPVWETLFSMYRKLARGDSPGLADALHLHQLIYRRLVRAMFDDDEVRDLLSRNNRTTPYLIAFAMMSVAPAVFFWNNTWVLVFFTALFAVTYVSAYLMIVRFKIPEWLKH